MNRSYFAYMNYYPNPHNRQSIRLPGYDYSLAGVYFVTICTKHGTCIFGQIVNGEMLLNNAGTIADEYLKVIPTKFSQTKIHEYVIMPNHMYVLLSFTKTRQRINTIIGNGKRFMAYEIIQRLDTGGVFPHNGFNYIEFNIGEAQVGAV